MRPPTVRVMSYNVHALKGERAALVEVIRTVGPDVLCLQEAPRHPFSGHRISGLAQDCGLLWSGGERGRMSTTVLAGLRLEVLAAGHRLFPVPRPAEPRGWAYVVARVPGRDPFVTVSLHLSLKAAERASHATLLREARELADGHPLVLAGDVNETSEGPAWRVLRAELEDPVGDALTFPAVAPRKRIDAIFTSPRLRARPVTIDLDPALLAGASDHLPVAVDIGV